MKKCLIAAGLVLAVVFAGVAMPVVDTYAKDGGSDSSSNSCDKTLFGMRPWYMGRTKMVDGKCVIDAPTSDAELPGFVWTIVLNILFDLFAILGVVSIGFIILGGYWYLRSGGDPTFVARGKKTIQAAVVGTVIALLATLITNLLTTILTAK